MRTLILSAWNEEFEPLGSMMHRTHRAYAERIGASVQRGRIDDAFPAAWSKVYGLYEELTRYDVVMWIDADAMVTNLDGPQPEQLLHGRDWAIAHDGYGLNSGVMVLRSCDWVREVLWLAWMLRYKFRQDSMYEQTALIHALDAHLDKVHIPPQRTMNAYATEFCGGNVIPSDNGNRGISFCISRDSATSM